MPRLPVLLLVLGAVSPAFSARQRVTAVPRELGLDPFYGKYLDAGFPICSSEKVSDYALLETGHLVGKMLANRPDIVAKMRELNLRCIVMGIGEFTTDIPEYAHRRPASFWDRRGRGYGPGDDNPVVSCAEENLLCYPGDPWAAEKDHRLPSLDIARADTARSTDSTRKTDIFILNKSGKKLKVYWIDFEGKRRPRTVLHPNGNFHSNTFATHPWLVTDMRDRTVGLYLPEKERYIVLLRPAGKRLE